MQYFSLHAISASNQLTLTFEGELTLASLGKCEKKLHALLALPHTQLLLNFEKLTLLDTSASIYINTLKREYQESKRDFSITHSNESVTKMLDLVEEYRTYDDEEKGYKEPSFLEKIGAYIYEYYIGILSFIAFLGLLFTSKFNLLKSLKNLRHKEIAFAMKESAIKALLIVSVTSFLIGLVVAYQSAYQLKLYGANIFIVDMLGLSILRELSPLITAIVIAGRSGSAFTAQIGAMKITEELDAMRTMGFDPYVFLVLPRIIALMIAMPLLIFVSDIMALLGGMIVANVDLDITTDLFLDRFADVIAIKHFFVGIVKGPFFAFLIASIGIYRGLMVQNDTQSIGFNTTKSVVESIFAVIVCDAIFSIAFTNLGI